MAEGGDAGGSLDRNRDARPVAGSLDGNGRHAADVPVVGHDVERSAGGVPAGNGGSGRGYAQEDQDAPQDAGAVAGGRGSGAEERGAGLDAGKQSGVRKSGSVAVKRWGPHGSQNAVPLPCEGAPLPVHRLWRLASLGGYAGTVSPS